MTAPRRAPALWAILVLLVVGAAIVYGGFSIYADQRSGVPGKAKVTECEGGSRYSRGIRCRGTWEIGGDAIFGDGQLVLGRVEGADTGDEGKTIDVRIHGTDHATVPNLATPIVLWALGGVTILLSLLGLWRWLRSRAVG